MVCRAASTGPTGEGLRRGVECNFRGLGRGSAIQLAKAFGSSATGVVAGEAATRRPRDSSLVVEIFMTAARQFKYVSNAGLAVRLASRGV